MCVMRPLSECPTYACGSAPRWAHYRTALCCAGLRESGIAGGALTSETGCAAGMSASCKFWSCFVDARSSRGGFQCVVSFVIGWSCVPSSSKASSRVPAGMWSSWFPRVRMSSEFNGPCLRWRRLALELTILRNDNTSVERTDLMLLAFVHHEDIICFSNVGLLVRTALCTPLKRSLMARPLCGRSARVGHCRRGSVFLIGPRCWDVSKL